MPALTEEAKPTRNAREGRESTRRPVIGFVADPAMDQRLRELSEKHKVTVSDILRHAVQRFLDAPLLDNPELKVSVSAVDELRSEVEELRSQLRATRLELGLGRVGGFDVSKVRRG